MKLALVGKGGVGKTSISGTLARLLARSGRHVLAVDGDLNPNLAMTLGITAERLWEAPALSAELVEHTGRTYRLTQTLEEISASRSLTAPDGVTLLATRPAREATGCQGLLHATIRCLVAAASAAPQDICVLDTEASLEHFAQNKALHADTILVVVEPYFRSLMTGRRMIGLARQLSPERLMLVANKVRDERELESVQELAIDTGLEIAGVIPYDERLPAAERARTAPLDFDPDCPAVTAIGELAERLLAVEWSPALHA